MSVIVLLFIAMTLIILHMKNKTANNFQTGETEIQDNVAPNDENGEEPIKEQKSGTNETNDNVNKPESKNMILSMPETDRRAANIFFSNFSEAFFWEYSRENKDDDYLISFAFIHNLLNNADEIIWQQDRDGISGKAVNRTLDKYFGVTIPLKSTSNADGDPWIYEDNVFWKPASDGESFDYFSIVSDMYDMGDGTLQAKYDVFYAGYDELTKECYSYTTAEANKKCEFIYSATAVVKPKTYNGKNTYELISLKKN